MMKESGDGYTSNWFGSHCLHSIRRSIVWYSTFCSWCQGSTEWTLPAKRSNRLFTCPPNLTVIFLPSGQAWNMDINHNVSEKSVHLCKQKNVLQKDGIFIMNTRSQIDKVRANSYSQISTTPKSRMTLTYHALYLPLDHHEQMVTRHDQARESHC
jgi:hypothetical protein